MDITTLFTLLGLVSAFANRAAEGVKAILKTHTDISAEVQSEIALAVSIVAGIIGALALNTNLLSLLPADSYLASVPPLVGVILTGCVASVGSEGIQWVMDLFGAKRDELQSRADNPSTMSATMEASISPMNTIPQNTSGISVAGTDGILKSPPTH